MLPRFGFVAGMAISVVVALLIWAAYVSILIFRHDTAEAETVGLSDSPQAKSDAKSVSDLYVGPHIIIVCSELAQTQPRMGCP
jgi:hypothetical protein